VGLRSTWCSTVRACAVRNSSSPRSGAFIADVLNRLQVRYPEVQVLFADTRAFAEGWTYRFLAAALADVDLLDPA
jgi:hypothetical protein